MWWLAFVAPVVIVVLFMVTGRRDPRRDVEIAAWSRRAGRPRGVAKLPGPLARILTQTGGGAPVGYFELAPKLAYLACMAADAVQGSEHVTVVAKLDDDAPTFCVRPLPVLEGERAVNTGVIFKKDPEFTELFLVEGSLDGEPEPVSEQRAKAIRKWLSPPLREALLDVPDAWLRVDGKTLTMAITRYGLMDADKTEALVEAADIVFAEYGAGGGPSLLPPDGEQDDGDEPEAPKPPPAKSAKPQSSKRA